MPRVWIRQIIVGLDWIMFGCVNKIMTSDFCKMFIVNSTFHSHDTRIKNKLHQDSHKLMLRSNTVRIAGVLLWNSLSDELSDASSYVIFKNYYRRYLIDHLCYSYLYFLTHS